MTHISSKWGHIAVFSNCEFCSLSLFSRSKNLPTCSQAMPAGGPWGLVGASRHTTNSHHRLLAASLVAASAGACGAALQLPHSHSLRNALPHHHRPLLFPFTSPSSSFHSGCSSWPLLITSSPSQLQFPATFGFHLARYKPPLSHQRQTTPGAVASCTKPGLASPRAAAAAAAAAASAIHAMPAPYSDNMYSEPEPSVSGSAAAAAAAGGGPGSRDDDDGSAAAASALSPSDGYFHASADEEAAISPTSHYPGTHQQPSHPSHRSSASVPYVPNVLVEDPTLSKDPDSKAHLAQRLINTDDAAAATSTASPSSRHHSTSHYQPQSQPHHNPQSYYYPSASPSVSGASVATPSTITSASQTRSYSQSGPSHQQRPLHVDTSPRHQSSYNHQADAPPAYTPSSPDNNQSNYNYSTFPSVTSSSMGVPEEQQSLLPGQQQRAFSDPPKQPLWQRIKDSHDSGSLRQRIKRVLGILVLISIVLVFMGFNMSGPEYRVCLSLLLFHDHLLTVE